jgi:hypothetical protein
MRYLSWISNRWFWVVTLLALLVGGGWAWLEWNHLQAWYFAHRLAGAAEGERDDYVERLQPLGEAAIAPLMSWLTTDDATACGNCGYALAKLPEHWGMNSPQATRAVEVLAEEFPRCSHLGRKQVLEIVERLSLQLPFDQPPAYFLEAVGRVVGDVKAEAEPALRAAAIRLAVRWTGPGRKDDEPWLRACRSLATAGLREERGDCRADAVRLAVTPGVGLPEKVAALLNTATPDASAEVRRLAVLAVGGAEFEEIWPTEDILRYLHDANEEVRLVCEQALRTRGLDGRRLQLAQMLGHPDAAVRAQVPAQIFRIAEVDPCLWLNKLSGDPAPAVRAAAARAAFENREPRFHGRLKEMAERDPSPTVRQIAEIYANLPPPPPQRID